MGLDPVWISPVRHTISFDSPFQLLAEPLITVLSALIFGKQVNTFVLKGGLLIFTGVYLVTK
jgi:drug/metabolite transporter (DMT)-like permease